MTQQKMNLIYDSPNLNCRILFKRLKDKNRYAVIVLPREGHKIEDVLKNLKFDEMQIYFNASQRKYVKLTMPKFKILGPHDLVNTFKSFGLTDMFDPHRSDFGRMTTQSVFIGTFIQVIHFDIRESGVNTEIDDYSYDGQIVGEGEDVDDIEDVEETTQIEQEHEKDEDDHSSSEIDSEKDDDDENENDHLSSESDSEKDEDVEPRQTSENLDEDEERFIPSHPESDDSEDPGDEPSHDPAEFLVNGPFLFFIYSSKEDLVFYSAAVTNPSVA
ncbi:hypothetical protein RF11_16498 [Thelohanellus kitauei]|uniref:Serpin domain-containing protein n=1 Tax=Thelohanellus kitauei TaxID=669202 RepID=A0A0C2JRZ3_THEKT|nr:hypothetical protein RF11_16498 [Thelohanellus kitauei]